MIYILYDKETGQWEGSPENLTISVVAKRNYQLQQLGNRSRRWVPHFTTITFTAEASYHANPRHHTG